VQEKQQLRKASTVIKAPFIRLEMIES